MLLLMGCRHTWGEYLVPVGAEGSIPSGAGSQCAVKGESGIVSLVQGSRFHVDGEGKVKVRCSEADVFLEGRVLVKLRVDGPARLKRGDFPSPGVSVEAVAADGRVFDLALLSQGSFAWTFSESLKLRQPSCGDMAPLCAGGVVGNGRTQRLDVLKAGPGTIDLGFLGRTAHLDVQVDEPG